MNLVTGKNMVIAAITEVKIMTFPVAIFIILQLVSVVCNNEKIHTRAIGVDCPDSRLYLSVHPKDASCFRCDNCAHRKK